MKSKIFILLAVGILVLSVADVNAQVKGGSFSITPFAGYNFFKYRSSYDDTETYGLAIGYNFSERLSLEATYAVLDTEISSERVVEASSGGGGFPPPPGQFPPPPGAAEPTYIADEGTEVDAFEYALEGLFYIYPGKKFAPYGVIGIGMIQFEYALNEEGGGGTKKVIDHNLPIGFGFKYFVTDMIAVRGDYRAVFPFDQNNMRATLGVTFQFGGN